MKKAIVLLLPILLIGCCTFRGMPQSAHDKEEAIYRAQTKIVLAQLSLEVAKLNYVTYAYVTGDSKAADYQQSLTDLEKIIVEREKILKDLLIDFGAGGN